MFAERLIVQPALRRLSIIQQRMAATRHPCDLLAEGCPVDALRAALAREEHLLREKEALLQEQEVLRMESDHRLLNGLQMVVSMLSLQSQGAGTRELAAQLCVAANRVGTIARVHRRLHFHDGTKTVALKTYLQDLCGDFSSFSNAADPVREMIAVTGREINIPTATAVPLGFIVNELVTNACKHGAAHTDVQLDVDPDKGYVLSVSNDGPALPDDFDPDKCKGLGMKIIRSLVRKIGGEFAFGRSANDKGARFVVRFS